MNSNDRFTERAKTAIEKAQEAAEELGHSYVGSEHLLLGILRERGTPSGGSTFLCGQKSGEKRTARGRGLEKRPTACGARKNHRAYADPRFFRPLRLVRLALSATGGARLTPPLDPHPWVRE